MDSAEQSQHAVEDFREQSAFTKTQQHRRRGGFAYRNVTFGYGNGRKLSLNYWVDEKASKQAVGDLLRNPAIRRIAGFQNSTFNYFTHKTYVEYQPTNEELLRHHLCLCSNFPLPSIREATQRMQPAHAYFSSALRLLQSGAVVAYHVCLDTELQATNQDLELDVIGARLLILEAFCILTLANIVSVIHSCKAPYDELYKLGQSFMDNSIRTFRKLKAHTSSHPSHPSFNKDKEKVQTEIERALRQDSYRRTVKGAIGSKVSMRFKRDVTS
ncbi:hypothetical protein F5877DRAFT_77500 [Lentinula edodes]|nr:hypothetical protein F5877DRAFT_77500 [Lentinula edodes]